MAAEVNPARVRLAWWATVILFLVHGLLVATWVSRIPAVQSALHISNGVLGLTLLSTAIGAVSTIPITGWLITRYGSRRVAICASLSFCCSLVLPALAFNAVTLSFALLVFGALAAAMDVSMNAHGVEVEKELASPKESRKTVAVSSAPPKGRAASLRCLAARVLALRAPTMSRFHGMFSLGGMIGAAVGGWIAARGITPLPHFAASSGINLALVLLAWPALLDTHQTGVESGHRLPLNRIPRVLLALSAIAFCMLLSEGAMADWTAVYMRQVLGAGAGIAAQGYAVFSAAMACFRFLGDIITARLGPLLTVRAGSLVGAAGLTWALSMHSPAWALPGFAATGAGFSVIIPLVFGSGGRVGSINPGAGIATVTGIGYVGFIIGPPAIGFASQLFTLRYALGVVVICCLISAVLSGSMRLLLPDTSSRHAAEIHI